jgi:SAM-dependent methyltransferase
MNIASRFGAGREDGITVAFREFRRALLQRLFNTLYSVGQWAYDPLTVMFFGSAWHEWRQTALPWIVSGRTLELGCGTGALLQEIAARSTFAVGLDLEHSMLMRARGHVDRPDLGLVRGDGLSLPFAGESFDTVVATFPSGYIASAPAKCEIARILRPGGVFAIVASARFSRFQLRRPFIHPVLRIAYGSGRSMNRWPDQLLSHPQLPGGWHDIETKEGVAYVWIARKLNERS